MLYLKSSVNNHFWYGGLSTLNYILNDEISISGGLDLRYYKGQHYSEVYDLLGGDYTILTDNQNQFIFFDIKPRGVKPANKDYLENYRFAWEYDNPKGIIEGLRQFRKTYEFVNKEELNPEPARKQKRND